MNEVRGKGERYKITFYTVNNSVNIQKTDQDVTDGIITLNGSELMTIGEGVMNFRVDNIAADAGYNDGVYNSSFTRTTKYYIVSSVIIPDGEDTETVIDLISELQNSVSSEITRSTAKDNAHDAALANVYTKTEIDNMLDDIDVDLPDNIVIDANYVHTDNNYTTADRNKLAGLNNYDDTSLSNRVDSLENDINDKADKTNTVSNVSYNSSTKKISKTINGTTSDVVTLHSVATSGNYNVLSNRPTIPTKTSQLTNDSNFVVDANYVHTDNNYTTAERNKLANTYTKSEVDDLIDAGGGSLPSGVVIDANYVHTDNNYTTTEKTKLAGLDGKQRIVIQVFTPNATPSFKDVDGNTMTYSQIHEILTDENKEPVLYYSERYYNISSKMNEEEGGYIEYGFTFIEITSNGASVRTLIVDDYTEDAYIETSYTSKSINTAITTNAGFGQGYMAQTNASASASVTATLTSYALTNGGIVVVSFNYDVPANATLNITSKGAKPMYFRGQQITAGVIKAGDTATFIYFSNKYNLISNDRWGIQE